MSDEELAKRYADASFPYVAWVICAAAMWWYFLPFVAWLPESLETVGILCGACSTWLLWLWSLRHYGAISWD